MAYAKSKSCIDTQNEQLICALMPLLAAIHIKCIFGNGKIIIAARSWAFNVLHSDINIEMVFYSIDWFTWSFVCLLSSCRFFVQSKWKKRLGTKTSHRPHDAEKNVEQQKRISGGKSPIQYKNIRFQRAGVNKLEKHAHAIRREGHFFFFAATNVCRFFL